MTLKNIKKIGLYDSGVGGLTLLNQLSNLNLKEIVYFADTKYLPYGEKPISFIIKRNKGIVRHLQLQGINHIIIACHTSAAVALDTLKIEFPSVYFINPIEATVRAAIQITKNKIVGVMATTNSIETHIHARAMQHHNQEITIIEQACPDLVPLIEAPRQNKTHLKAALQKYAHFFKNKGVDTIILGCTHYPLVINDLQRLLPCVRYIGAHHGSALLLNKKKMHTPQTYRFLVTGDKKSFVKSLKRYMNDYEKQKKEIKVEIL